MWRYRSAKTGYYLHKILSPWYVVCNFGEWVWGWSKKVKLIVLCVIAILLYDVLFLREYSAIYRDFVRVNGEPIGLGEELSAEPVDEVSICFRLYHKGVCSISLEKGWLPRFVRSRNERVVVMRPLLNESAAQLPLCDRISAFGCFSALFSSCSVRVWDFTYDRRTGLCRETARGGWSDEPFLTVEYAPKGLNPRCRSACVTISPSGKSMPREELVAKFWYDENGHETRMELSDKSSANLLDHVQPLVVGPVHQFKYDKQGYIVSECFCDSHGRLCACQDGYAGWLAERDAQGREICRSWIGDDGAPYVAQCGIVSVRRSYLPRGYEERYFDVKGKLCPCANGDSGFDIRLDAAGRLLSKTWIGVDGLPTRTLHGPACLQYQYDRRGHCTSIERLNTCGSLCRDWLGVAKEVMRYDIFGELIETRCLDIDQSCLEMIKLPFCRCTGQNSSSAAFDLFEWVMVCRMNEYSIDELGTASFPMSYSVFPEDDKNRTMIVAKRKLEGGYVIAKVDVPNVCSGFSFREFQVSQDEWRRVLRAYADYGRMSEGGAMIKIEEMSREE